MLSVNLKTPLEIMLEIAARAKAQRLTLNLSQTGLGKRSGVSLGTIKRFESTGKISIDALLKIAMALGCLNDFTQLFTPTSLINLPSLDHLLKEPKIRKRGKIT